MKDLIAKLQLDANCALGAIWMHIDAQAARIAELEAQIAAASAPAIEKQPVAKFYARKCDLDYNGEHGVIVSKIIDGYWNVPLFAAAHQAADTDILDALELLAAVFDAWENGDDCYEDPEECAGFLGKAFRLDDDIFNRCVELLNRRNPPRNAASTAVQAPVREVPESDWMTAITTPDNWRKITEHGNPPDGFYMVIYKGDGKSMPVTLAGYGEYEFYSEDDDRETAGIGWTEYSEDPNGDCFTIIRDVIAYLPVNVDIASLKAVRASLPADPVQPEGV